MGVILLDTNVLLLSVGADHPLKEAARSLLTHVASGGLRASTTPEVIQEFAHVRGRRTSRKEAAALATQLVTVLQPLIITLPDDLPEALRLWQRHPRLGSFDSLLISTAHRVGADAVVSADGAMAEQRLVPHLTIEQAAHLAGAIRPSVERQR